MKKWKMRGLIPAILLVLCLNAPNANAQSATITAVEHPTQRVVIVTISWIADGVGAVSGTLADADANLPNILAGRHCYNARTTPGVPAPTLGYDVVVATPDGIDVFGGRLADRSDTVAETTAPLVTNTTDGVTGAFTVGFDTALNGDIWTFAITNAGAGGTGALKLFFR